MMLTERDEGEGCSKRRKREEEQGNHTFVQSGGLKKEHPKITYLHVFNRFSLLFEIKLIYLNWLTKDFKMRRI